MEEPLSPSPADPAVKKGKHDDSQHSRGSSASSSAKSSSASKIEYAPISSLFSFATAADTLLFLVGCFFSILASATLPGICIAFGDVIDSMATATGTSDVLEDSVLFMCYIGVYGFLTFLFAFYFTGWAAARIANGFRIMYLEAVLRQDATFFDQASPGSVPLTLSDGAFEIQNGLADKFAGMVQGFFQLVFGFGLAFYYNAILPLVLLGMTPLMGFFAVAMMTCGSTDGVFGKEAYERAANVASESLSNVRTVFSLNAEPTMSKKYDAELGDSEKAAVRQGSRQAFFMGGFMSVMWVMYGLGFWYGGIIVADSTDKAIAAHPAPEALVNVDPDVVEDPFWYGNASVADQMMQMAEVAPNNPYLMHQIVDYKEDLCTSYKGNDEAYAVCMCGIPWDIVPLPNPKCGCGAYDSNSADSRTRLTSSGGCFSGGRVILVFFAILIGAFSASQIGPGLKALQEARAAAAKMLRVIRRRPDIDVTATEGKVRLLDKKKVEGKITFEDVHFRYAPTLSNDGSKGDADEEATADNTMAQMTRPVFGGCDLVMEPGQTVALVGESGCGKSTIAKLVQRFYDPTAGRILLDGVDLRDLSLTDLRSVIGVVSQEPLLFNKSIKENIRVGRPEATDEEIMAAARAANAHDFIQSFPEKYDTQVGRKGGKLSGGQKQRVAIARAILRDPPVLILDEATSALDSKSEKVVQMSLDKLIEENGGKRTTILIAHRLSTVRNADKIVVLGSPEGTSTAATGSQILEQGTHDELMALGGFYKALVGAGERKVSESDYKQLDRMASSGSMLDVVIMDDIMEGEHDSKKEANDLEEGGGGKKKKKKGGGLCGKKEVDPEEAEKAKKEKLQAKENKSRVWQYTWPEIHYIVIGLVCSLIKGTFFPLLALFFSDLLTVLFDQDTDNLREEALYYSLIFYGLGIASGIFDFIQKSLFELIGERITKRLRSDTFRAMLRQDITWFEDEANDIGTLSSRLSTDVKLVRLVASQSMAAAVESCSALSCGIIIALIYSWEMFLIMIAMVPLLSITEGLQWMMLQGNEGEMRAKLTKSTDLLYETVNGIREVQAFSMEGRIGLEIKNAIIDQIGPISQKAAAMKGSMMGMIQLVSFAVYALAFWAGGQLVENDRINFEEFNKSLWAMAFASSSLGQTALFAGDAAKASSAVKAIFGTIDSQPEIDSQPWENNGKAGVTGEPVVRKLSEDKLKNGNITLDKVNFAYPTRKAAKVFDEVDLTIPGGKVVAMVGSSGSGKSTIIQLLERFYDPISYKEEKAEDGTTSLVRTNVNGYLSVDEQKLLDSDCRFLRQNMSLVGQEPVLFNDTVYNNIALGKPSGNCTAEEVYDAARRANAYDFVMQLEDGFDTIVGNAGGKVSGGQKQRIAIARALVNRPKILLLDEATSALDNESEKIVQASLDKLMKESENQSTTIIIAHRLSTIKDADLICVLENKGDGSKVVEMGTHDELMALGQKYKALVKAYVK